MTNPPITAVTRVDFLRQIPITKGEIKFVTAMENGVNQSEKEKRSILQTMV